MAKASHPQINPKRNVSTQKSTKNFDYTTIADRLRTVNWSNKNHPTGVVKQGLKGTNLPLAATAVKLNEHDTAGILFTIQNILLSRWIYLKCDLK